MYSWIPDSVPYGFCACGCGHCTPLATRTRNGYRKGEPVKWCRGHFQRSWPPNLKYEEEDRGYPTSCWIWTGSRDRKQYGTYSGAGRGRRMHAHIVSYEWHKGPVPEGYELDHLCRQTLCINPDHLEPVTHAENVRRGLSTKLTPDEVVVIRASSLSQRALARQFGVSKSQIANIRHYRSWADVGS